MIFREASRLAPMKRQNNLQAHAGMAAATLLELYGSGMQAATNHARLVRHESSGRAEVEDHLVANLQPTLTGCSARCIKLMPTSIQCNIAILSMKNTIDNVPQ